MKRKNIIYIVILVLTLSIVIFLFACSDASQTQEEIETKNTESDQNAVQMIGYTGKGILAYAKNDIPLSELNIDSAGSSFDMSELQKYLSSLENRFYNGVILPDYEDYLMQYYANGWTALELSEKSFAVYKESVIVCVYRLSESMLVCELRLTDKSFLQALISQNSVNSGFGWPNLARWECVSINQNVEKPAEINAKYYSASESKCSLSLKLENVTQASLASAVYNITNSIAISDWKTERGNTLSHSVSGIQDAMDSVNGLTMLNISCRNGEITYVISARLYTSNSDDGKINDASILIRAINATDENPFYSAFTSFDEKLIGVYTARDGSEIELCSDASILIDGQKYFTYFDSDNRVYCKKDSIYLPFKSDIIEKTVVLDGVLYVAPNSQGFTVCLNSAEIAGTYYADYGGKVEVLSDGTYCNGKTLYIKDSAYYDCYKRLLECNGEIFKYVEIDSAFYRLKETASLPPCDIEGTYLSFVSDKFMRAITIDAQWELRRNGNSYQMYQTINGAYFYQWDNQIMPLKYNDKAFSFSPDFCVYELASEPLTPYTEADINGLFYAIDSIGDYLFVEVNNGILTYINHDYSIYRYENNYYYLLSDGEYIAIELGEDEVTIDEVIYIKSSIP